MNERKAGVLLSYAYNGMHILINLIYVPLLLRFIGQEEYGLYQIVGSIVSYFNVMESSLSAGVLRFYCKFKAVNDEENMENTLAVSKRIYNLLSLIVAGLGIAGVIFIRLFYGNSFSEHEVIDSQVMVVMLTLNLIVNLQNYVYVAIISGNEKYIFSKILGITTQLLQPIIVIVIIRRIPYAIVIVVIQLLLNVVVAIIRRGYCIKTLHAKIVPQDPNRNLAMQLLVFSTQILFAVIADQIFWKTDQILIGRVYGTALAAVYGVGAQIYLNYAPIGTAVSGVFMPHISLLYQESNRNTVISALFAKVGRIAAYLLLLVLTTFALFGREFIFLWVGDGYQEAFYVALIVMIPYTIDLMQNLALTILQVYDKYSFRGKIYFVVALMNILLTLIMLRKYGIVGAAVATAISMFIADGIIMNIYYLHIGIDIKRYWGQVLPIVVVAISCFSVGLLISQIHIASDLAQFIVHCAFYVICYGLVMFLFVFNQYEKSLIDRVLKKICGNCGRDQI